MKDGEGQLVTNTWTVTESLNPEAAVPSLFSSGLPNEFASLPSFHVCFAAKWVSNGPRRELTEIEKKNPPGRVTPPEAYTLQAQLCRRESRSCARCFD